MVRCINGIILCALVAGVALVGCGKGGGGGRIDPPSEAYTVIYDANGAGGTVPVDATEYQSGDAVTVPGNTGNLVKTGYSFTGWNTTADGSGMTFTQGATFAITADVTLYAKWSANPTYAVTYNANGGTLGIPAGNVPVDTTRYESGSSVHVLGNTGNLVLAGYIFADWNSKPDGSGTSYSIGTSMSMANANITLYAQWLDETKIIFTNIGTASDPVYSIKKNGSLTGSVCIPSYYNGYPVTKIDDSAFGYCGGMTSISIPNSVKSIGDNAFVCCSGLTNITIPDSVTSIGSNAFYGCSGMTSITIPDSVTSVGSAAFYGCSGMTSITIPDSVTSIGSMTFSGCIGLVSMTIPSSVTSIGNGAFDGCSGMTSITIPNSVKSIGSSAFNYCSGLTSITIPNSVTSIGDYAFALCTGLSSITIESANPPGTGACAFISIHSGAIIHVPFGKVNDYTIAGYGAYGTVVEQ